MDATSLSLLDRLRSSSQHSDWDRFVAIYQPYILRFICLDPDMAADSADICQEVMAKIVKHLPRFERQRDGSFRNWLKTVTANEVKLHWRQHMKFRRMNGLDQTILDGLLDAANPLSEQWDREHAGHVLRRLQDLIEHDFAPTTWRAFRLRVLEEKPTKEVSEILGISESSVDVAKSRVLARLRAEAAGFLED